MIENFFHVYKDQPKAELKSNDDDEISFENYL